MIEEMKRELDAVKSELVSVKSDVGDLKSIVRRIAVTTSALSGKLDALNERIATKADIDGLNRRMDGFAGLQEDMRFRWAIHADTLTEHHRRLTKLESRRA